ncbi:type II secretion system F family protein [Luteipulveratus sp. YIM 133132]|uniref:Type II secretion system F family protein n=1 Tax=Luteipulveratus flavus TaxID=3031728 RepID=A0ABT6C7B5_9MICO|nr:MULTISPECIES: type II secretion system F family protein [unclassified Luteipulveratus]MDE9367753.1 type II secretion system F family protein [Luteipulveratus sp. YIM 133132]MDF8264207.1 type II secretion system F family protein [Luteipulveratus sp. YIM 133296]
MTAQVWSWPGALMGAAVGFGLLLAYRGLPLRRRVDLNDRIAPYVRDSPRPSRLLTSSGVDLGVHHVLQPALHRLGAVVDQVLGGASSVRRRLERAGQPTDVEGFRAQQALWGVLAGTAGTVLASLRWLSNGTSLVGALAVVGLSVGGGVIARDQALTRAARRREERILAEFPSVAEMLALAVAAGEGAAAALDRVARLSTGELSGELERCLADARAGASLPEALQGMADRTGISSLARFVDGIVVAVERGTPLADVMRAQAQDAREASKQQLIEEGGKREIAMMVPVVFLVLPVTILFAVYPGLSELRLSL